MGHTKIVFMSSESDSWEGMYVNGELQDEAHHLLERKDDIIKLLKLVEELRCTSDGVSFHTLTEEDDEILMDKGNFPKYLHELKDYNKYFNNEDLTSTEINQCDGC
jgi:hypothetical protein